MQCNALGTVLYEHPVFQNHFQSVLLSHYMPLLRTVLNKMSGEGFFHRMLHLRLERRM